MNEALPTAPAPTASDRSTSAAGKIGVLLVNLGTPEAADAPAVRRYLKEFLTDPRVIEDQGALWQLALNGVILPIRPRRKARDYAGTLRRRGALTAQLQARGRPRLVPRRAEGLCGQRRSLLCPLRRDRPPSARAAQSRAVEIDDDVSVPVRPRQVARARDQSHPQDARQERGEEHRGDHAGLFGRLPRNAGGDRNRG